MTKYLKKEQLIALLLTLLFSALTVTTLVCTKILPVSPTITKASDVEEEEIFFADIEYQEISTDPTMAVDNEAASAAEAEMSATDMSDSGAQEETPTLVSADKPSEAKVSKPEEPKPAPGPTKEEIEAEKAAKIRDRMGKSSGLKTQTSDAGRGNAESGNASSGNNPGATGLGLAGRKCIAKADPGITNATGTICIDITVDAKGNVTSAKWKSSSGTFGSREDEVRNACVAASRKLKYNPDPSKPSQSGTITWNIR